MPFLLSQFVKLEQDPLKKYVLENMLRQIKIMEVLPFEDVDSLRVTALRWSHLPAVAFRPLNSDYTEDTSGNVEEVWESLYIMGGTVKFDRVFDKVKNTIKDPKRLQLDMKIKALALTWNDYFINGDQAVDPEGFEGCLKRSSLMPARQTVIPTAAGATSLDVTTSAANVNLFWSGFEKAYARANGGDVQAIVMNEDLKLGLGRSLRYINSAGGMFLDVTKDSFERAVPTYKGTPIYDMGLKTDQTTEIITDTITAADAGADATDAYFLPFNMEQGITGIQLSALEVVPDAKKDVATANQTLLEWVNGLAGFGSYGIVRFTNILAPDTWTA
jgi:hypothetical protein